MAPELVESPDRMSLWCDGQMIGQAVEGPWGWSVSRRDSPLVVEVLTKNEARNELRGAAGARSQASEGGELPARVATGAVAALCREILAAADDTVDYVRLYQDGASMKQIAALMHSTPKQVRLLLRYEGVTIRGRGGARPRPPAPSLTAEQTAEAVRRYKAGEGVCLLAKSFGHGPATVRKALVQEGVTIRKGGGMPWALAERDPLAWAQQCREVARRYQTQPKVWLLAKEFHHGVDKIREMLRYAGITPPPPRKRARLSDAGNRARLAQTVVALRRRNLTVRQISAETGWSYNLVRKVLHERGYLGPSNGTRAAR